MGNFNQKIGLTSSVKETIHKREVIRMFITVVSGKARWDTLTKPTRLRVTRTLGCPGNSVRCVAGTSHTCPGHSLLGPLQGWTDSLGPDQVAEITGPISNKTVRISKGTQVFLMDNICI